MARKNTLGDYDISISYDLAKDLIKIVEAIDFRDKTVGEIMALSSLQVRLEDVIKTEENNEH